MFWFHCNNMAVVDILATHTRKNFFSPSPPACLHDGYCIIEFKYNTSQNCSFPYSHERSVLHGCMWINQVAHLGAPKQNHAVSSCSVWPLYLPRSLFYLWLLGWPYLTLICPCHQWRQFSICLLYKNACRVYDCKCRRNIVISVYRFLR